MRLFLNVSAVLVCGALAGVTALAQTLPSHGAHAHVELVSAAAVPALRTQADTDAVLVRHSGSVEAHFDAANTTHDGHLTRMQVDQSDWKRVSKHFDEIDTDHKGWISVDQIHAFNKSHRKHKKDAAA